MCRGGCIGAIPVTKPVGLGRKVLGEEEGVVTHLGVPGILANGTALGRNEETGQRLTNKVRQCDFCLSHIKMRAGFQK